MTEIEILAMRGYLDILIGLWLMRRFVAQASDFSLKLRFVQITIISFLLFILERLGVWHWQELVTAFKFLPVIWPLILVVLYFAYQNNLLLRSLDRAEFEIDWRREYQEVLIKELEDQGKEVPEAPQKTQE